MEFFDFGTIFFFIAAVIIFLQLRNVLEDETSVFIIDLLVDEDALVAD